MKTNTAQKIEISREISDGIYRRIAQAEKIVSRLLLLGIVCGVKRVLGVAVWIGWCIVQQNLWVGRNLHNENGELFNGKGTLWACNKRLCPFCSANLRRIARKKARNAVNWIKKNSREVEALMREKLQKEAKRAGTEKRQEIEKRLAKKYLDLRWRFLTLTAPKVRGRSVEQIIKVYNKAFSFLLKRDLFEHWVAGGIKGVEFTVVESDFHVHIHLIIYAEWIPWEQLQEQWTDCIIKAWKEEGHDLEINTPSGNVLTRISLVVPRARNNESGIISEDAAIQEVVKYVTKSDSWLKISGDQLLECALVEWPRMFEMFGCARVKEEKQEKVGEGSPTILDTPNLKIVSSELEPLADTGVLKVAEVGKKPRALPMLDWLYFMPFDKWVEKVGLEIAKRRTYRKQMLAERYPAASFMTLDGERFGVIEAPD